MKEVDRGLSVGQLVRHCPLMRMKLVRQLEQLEAEEHAMHPTGHLAATVTLSS